MSMAAALQIRGYMKRTQTIGEFVKEWRLAKSFSQRSLGDQIGIAHNYIVLIEKDRYQYPTEFIKKLYPLMTKAERAEAFEIMCASLKSDLEDK